MANRTDTAAANIHGTNPQNLVEKIVRLKIYETIYWKEHCFGLTAAGIVEKAVQLRYLGGTYGGTRRPTEFMCLVLKMLQIQPDKEIIIEFIKNEDYKYVRLLGAFYLRLVGKTMDIYNYLEPLYNDYRKVRLRQADGNYALSHVDEIVDEMLHKDYLFDIALPRITNRYTLEKNGTLDPRVSVLDDEFDEAALEEEAGRAAQEAQALQKEQEELKKATRRSRSRSRERRRSRSPRRERERDRDRERDRERDRDRDRGRDDRRERDRDREREKDRDREGKKRARSRSRERDKDSRKKREADAEDPEIAEANAMRAKLGLKPLK